ncbi:MAG TPA: S1 RNA-binding domain-containing protein, partial [Pedobacter sp.]
TNFGAFVDIGVHQDGLVHTSQLANKFVSNANEVVKVAQRVEVTVVEVDVARKRISLSMRTEVAAKPKQERKRENVKSKGSFSAPSPAPKPGPNRPDQQRKPAAAAQKPNAKVQNKPVQREKKNADGDLQLKLEALKNLFK